MQVHQKRFYYQIMKQNKIFIVVVDEQLSAPCKLDYM